MEIIQKERGTGGLFIASGGSKEMGRLIYTNGSGDNIIIDSTKVHEEFEGKGVGKELVLAAVEFARQNGMTIIPVCPFAKKILERGGYEDVLEQQVP